MIKPHEILQVADTISKVDRLTRKVWYLSHEVDDFTHKYAIAINNAIDFNNVINELKQANSLSDLTRSKILELAIKIEERNELLDNVSTFEDDYLTMLHDYANVLNEKYDLEIKLKEVGL